MQKSDQDKQRDLLRNSNHLSNCDQLSKWSKLVELFDSVKGSHRTVIARPAQQVVAIHTVMGHGTKKLIYEFPLPRKLGGSSWGEWDRRPSRKKTLGRGKVWLPI